MQAQRTGGNQAALRNVGQLLLWTLGWVVTLAVAQFGPEIWESQTVSWMAVIVNLAAGIGWIVGHARYLHRLDELQRKIATDALAITLGVGWVAGFSYVVADAAGLLAFDADLGVFSMLLAVVYMVAIAAGNLRYR